MTRSKVLAPIILLLLAVGLTAQAGCASSGNKKPTILVDQYNNVPADIQSQFLDRYRRFITGKERKEFEKLLTDEERDVFIENFWAKRDSDPATPENEFKKEVDDRIENIINESFFGTFGAGGLMFRSNGGFNGGMAHVYLLHGEPDVVDLIEGGSFVPMMLWVYINPENGRLLYAFMFYQKGGSGEFTLFYQDSYKMDQCGAIYEVATVRSYNYNGGGGQNCPSDLYDVYGEIARSTGKNGFLDGNMFAWALFNFSSNSDLKLEVALDPPKPASEIAVKSKARVVGEAPELVGTIGTDYIINSCERCNSLIPAQLIFDKELALLIRRSDVDWRVVNDDAGLELKVRVMVEDNKNQIPSLVFEKNVSFTDKKESIMLDPLGQNTVVLLTEDEVAKIPAGSYRVSVYVKNTMTQKYNAWLREIVVK